MTTFDDRNKLKKKLEVQKRFVFIYPQEVWLTHIGKNIGHEINGKDNNFVRPVLVIKRWEKTFFTVPMTTQ